MTTRAVLFDLFDTLVRFDRDRLPEVDVGGRVVRSTVGHLHPILRGWAPDVTLPAMHAALLESWQVAERERAIDDREVTAPERFAHLFRHLALDPQAAPHGLVHDLLEAHRRELSRAAEFPPHHRALLADLAGRYRLAVVSNFDYTPTALGILDAAGIADLFETVVVSDAVGWRKPSPRIFHQALGRLGLAPEDALFVGDRADIDVLGAQRVGMPVAWINPKADPLPAGIARPDHEIRDLDELRPILGV
jgi:putative hydrolase of the HAD superfamily